MALERSLKQFFFAKGPESEVTHEAIKDGDLTILENAHLDRIGTIKHKIGVTAGVTAVENFGGSGPSTTGTIVSVDNYAETPEVTSEGSYHVGNAPATRYKWNSSLGKWNSPMGSSSAILGSSSNSTVKSSTFILSDVVAYDGLLYVATTYVGRVEFSIFDPVTNQKIVDIDTALNPLDIQICRVIELNGIIYFFRHFGGSSLYCVSYNPVTAAISSAALVTDMYNATGCVYDIWADTVSGIVYVAYKETAGAKVFLRGFSSLTPAVLVYSLNTVYTVGNQLAISGCRTFATPSIFVGFSDATDANVSSFGTTLALVATFGLTVLYAGAANRAKSIVISDTQIGGVICYYVTSVEPGTAPLTIPHVSRFQHTHAGGTGVSQIFSNLEVFSKIKNINGVDYLWTKGRRVGQECLYLMSSLNNFSSPLYPVGKIYNGQGSPTANCPYINSRGFPLQISSLSNGQHYCGNVRLVSALSSTTSIYCQSFVTFDVGESTSTPETWQRWKTKKIAGANVSIGGYLNSYAGKMQTEVGFPEYPASELSSISSLNGTGSLTPLGAYSLCFVYEFFDDNGRSQLSAPSIPLSITLGAADDTIRVIFYDNIFNLTIKPYNVLVYRTAANGSIYYFDQRVVSGFSTFDLTQADSTLSQSASLYTQTGELENLCVPAPYDIEIFKDRLFVLTDEGLFYSKKVEINDPLEFSDALQIPIESDGGKPTSIIALQDKLLIFKNERIYYISGDGPNDTGTFGDFSLPQLITATYGCINPRSALAHDNVVFFQSSATMCVIDPSLTVTNIDSSLNSYWQTSPLIRTSLLVPEYKMIRWSDSQNTFVFFYNSKEWTVYPTTQCNSETVVNNLRYFVSQGALYYDNENNIKEIGGSASTLRVATGWIQLDNIEGFQRLYSFFLLGRKKGNHTLIVKIMYDYVPVVVETHTIDETTSNSYIYSDSQVFVGVDASAATGTDQTNKPYQYRIKTSRQKCQSVRILIEDQDASSGVGTVDLVAGAFEIGFKSTGVKTWMGSGRTV